MPVFTPLAGNRGHKLHHCFVRSLNIFLITPTFKGFLATIIAAQAAHICEVTDLNNRIGLLRSGVIAYSSEKREVMPRLSLNIRNHQVAALPLTHTILHSPQ